MKIELIPTITNQKTSLFSRVKRFFVGKLKPLKRDTFEKSTETTKDKNIIISRKYPNWCDGPETQYRNNIIAKTRCYYPDDVKKMESMTKEEAIKYSIKLDHEGKFYYSDSAGSLKDLEEFLHKCGKELKDVIIKDKK